MSREYFILNKYTHLTRCHKICKYVLLIEKNIEKQFITESSKLKRKRESSSKFSCLWKL